MCILDSEWSNEYFGFTTMGFCVTAGTFLGVCFGCSNTFSPEMFGFLCGDVY